MYMLSTAFVHRETYITSLGNIHGIRTKKRIIYHDIENNYIFYIYNYYFDSFKREIKTTLFLSYFDL